MINRWKKNSKRHLRRKSISVTPVAADAETLEHRLLLSAATVDVNDPNTDEHSVARQWNEVLLDAIRRDTPRPTVHARNLFHVSVAMYDAWVAYDETALPYMSNQQGMAEVRDGARAEAISHAAYGVLVNRFANSPGAAASLAAFEDLMVSLGYDPDEASTSGNSPPAVGNRIAQDILQFGLSDGSNESHNYIDTSGYQTVNPPLVVNQTGTSLNDPNHWQPLTINGQTQQFLTPHWGDVSPFAMTREAGEIHLDPGEPPQLGGDSDEEFKQAITRVIEFSSWLDPDQNVFLDISPDSLGNNALGYDNGTGYAVNPITGQSYESNIVNRADYGRVLAEFWADGPNSETPPGHWNSIANEVSDQLAEKRISGTELVNDLEWDVKLYVALNGAVHDAAVAAWDTKEAYDYVRPISMIRYMGGLGQSSDPSLPSYHPEGLPLVERLIEVITPESIADGRHEHLAGQIGEIAIFAWAGHPNEPMTEYGGVEWILAENWLPYQAENFVTPGFAAYVSGHSTFSRASAEVLTAFTGSPYFPGGLGTFTATAGSSLGFEFGPSADITLQWATYFDASDEAGISRIYGGIHVDADDYAGRQMGSQAGLGAFRLANRYFNGDLATIDLAVTHVGITVVRLNGSRIEVTDQRGRVLASEEALRVRSIEVTGGSRRDELRIDFQAGGRFWVEEGILFDGRGGQDSLIVLGNGSANAIDMHENLVTIDALRIETQSVETFAAQGFDSNDAFDLTGDAVARTYRLDGGDGDDLYRLSIQGANLQIRDVTGNDTLDFSQAESGVKISLDRDRGQPQRIGAGDNRLQLRGTLENVIGTTFDDWIMGNQADNHLIGGPGNDWLFGRAGNDRLEGGHGEDRIFGGFGNDFLFGNYGNDLLLDLWGQNQALGGPGDDWQLVAFRQTENSRDQNAEASRNIGRRPDDNRKPADKTRDTSKPRRGEGLLDLVFLGFGRSGFLTEELP